MPAVSPIVHARSAQVGIGERDSRRAWGQQLVVRGQLHSPMGKLVMRVAHVAPIRARCFNSKRTSFHVALELEHVESVDLRSAISVLHLPVSENLGNQDEIKIKRGLQYQYHTNTTSTRIIKTQKSSYGVLWPSHVRTWDPAHPLTIPRSTLQKVGARMFTRPTSKEAARGHVFNFTLVI